MTALLVAGQVATASEAQPRAKDYRCIIETMSAAERQSAVSAFGDTFSATADAPEGKVGNSQESKAAEANMIRVSQACTLKHRWTNARRQQVEIYTDEYITQLGAARALAQKGLATASLQRIWRQLTPAELGAIERLPNDQSFRPRELALLKAENAPQASPVQDLLMLYLSTRHDMETRERALARP